MAINTNINYQQVLSMALEDRSRGWQDLVSDSIPLFDVLRRKGLWESYSGPRIRQTLLIDLPSIQWYRDYDILANTPREQFNDAYWTPKMAAVPISLSMTEILNNRGENQLLPVLREYIRTAEMGLAQGLDAALYGDGTAAGGKALDGLGAAVPITPTNTYGGINRNTEVIWRTGSYNVATANPTIGTAFDSTTAKAWYDWVMGQHVRGRNHPDLIIASTEHWTALNAATMSIQRIQNENSVGRLGFKALEYIGPGGTAEIVWGGGIGSNMIASTSFFLNTDTLRMRFNPDRNFDNLFEGDGAKPINQDAIAQFVGWMGNMTMTNPRFNARLYG